MRLPLTRHGWPEMLFCLVFLGGSGAFSLVFLGGPMGLLLAGLAALLLIFSLAFFRDPERKIPGDEGTVVAPADGKVTDVLEVADTPFVGGPATRIGIFLSVFNVHVNRAPVGGRVDHLVYRPGGWLDARDPACADLNEAQDLGLTVDLRNGRKARVLVRQISGLVARRIVCRARAGQELARGERYGMIKLGSRTEVYLPRDAVAAVEVKPGDLVRGGSHVLARLHGGSEEDDA